MSPSSILPMRQRRIPDGTGTPLADAPYLYTVYSLLCSGWHPVKVALYLAEHKGVQVPVAHIDAYYATIPDEDLQFRSTAMLRLFRGLDIIADPLRTMHEMLALRIESLNRKLEATPEGAAWKPDIDVAAKEIFDMATQLRGMLYLQNPLASQAEMNAPRSGNTLRDLVRQGKKRVTMERVTIQDDDRDVIDAAARILEDDDD